MCANELIFLTVFLLFSLSYIFIGNHLIRAEEKEKKNTKILNDVVVILLAYNVKVLTHSTNFSASSTLFNIY